MTSYLQHLENNEAILLMYLAGELPEADRPEVEQMLASDAGLRAELELLRQTQELAFDALETLDQMSRPGLAAGEGQNRVIQQINEWVRRRNEPAANAGPRRQFPWWRVSFAAAACLMVGYYIWAVYDKLDNRPPDSVASDSIQDGNDSSPPTQPGALEQASALADDEFPHTPPMRELTPQEKLALLSNSLEDTSADDSSLHVAEVAAVVPIDGDASSDSKNGADTNPPAEP